MPIKPEHLRGSLLEERWEIVRRIVAERGRSLTKYSFFEQTWRELEEISAPAKARAEGGLLILKAPPGSGKTEAVLSAYIHCAIKRSCPWFSVIYALPTRSLVFAMSRRFSSALQVAGVWPATVTMNYSGLLAPSPFLEGDIAVSTYDTLLYAFYGSVTPGYHILLPMSKVSGSLVVLDEVQLLQDVHWFALTLLPYHVGSLLSFGADVVLMSATIPSVLEERLRETLKGRGLAEIREVEAKESPARGRIDVEVREGALPEGEELVKVLKDLTSRGDALPALIVLNTVAKAARVYQTLAGSGLDAEVLLLHSRLRAKARKHVEELFESPEAAARRGGDQRVILVATQVVEAGLDLDVRLLLTELSPVDSLIQRLGRCARKRDGFALVYKDPGGGRHIYPRSLLERTAAALEAARGDLSEAVSRLDSAQELLDSVYRREVVEELTSRVSELIDVAASFVGREFPSLIFSLHTHRAPREIPLLRLGYEVRCLYVDENSYRRLLEGETIELPAPDVELNVVRLTARGERLPACILHESSGSRFAVKLSLRQRDGNVEIIPRATPPGKVNLAELFSRDELLLLNPSYYVTQNGRELGVVEPYDEP